MLLEVALCALSILALLLVADAARRGRGRRRERKTIMQWHFDFKDWEEAFGLFYRRRCGERLVGDGGEVLGFRRGDPSLVFVVSTAPHTSGYWVEPGENAVNDEHTKVYRTVTAVRRLERRVRRERAKTANLSLGGVVT